MMSDVPNEEGEPRTKMGRELLERYSPTFVFTDQPHIAPRSGFAAELAAIEAEASRATVERIRAEVTTLEKGYGSDTDPDWFSAVASVQGILDEEDAP